MVDDQLTERVTNIEVIRRIGRELEVLNNYQREENRISRICNERTKVLITTAYNARKNPREM